MIRIGKYTSGFNLSDKLAKGGQGIIYKGYEIKNKKNEVAIKMI
jgi:hypothetical protein